MSKMREKLIQALTDFKTDYPVEQDYAHDVIDFLKKEPDAFQRHHLDKHITAGGFLLSPDGKKVLLMHHAAIQKWFQFGGHADGDDDVWRVALKEATEESGIEGIEFISKDIFALDIHFIPENKKRGVGVHEHCEIDFLMRAPHENFIINEESSELRWFTYGELFDIPLGPLQERMRDKWHIWLKSA